MKSMNFLRVTSIGLILAFSSVAAHAKGGTPQTHHCKLADGSVDTTKTKKQCHDAKGTWAKDGAAAPAASAAPAAAAAPAATPAPAAAPAAAPAPKS